MNFVNVVLQARGEEVWAKEDTKNGGGMAIKLLPQTSSQVMDHVGKKVIMGIRPEDIHATLSHSENGTEGTSIVATVDVVEPMGAEMYLYLSTGCNTLVARVEPQCTAKPRQTIQVAVNLERVHIFDHKTQKMIA